MTEPSSAALLGIAKNVYRPDPDVAIHGTRKRRQRDA